MRHFLKRNSVLLFLILAAPAVFSGCLCHPQGRLVKRKGDEIVVAGKFFHTGTKVVLWMDPGGYDAYRVERRFVPIEQAGWDESRPHMDWPRTPNRYGMRDEHLTADELERIRGGGWDLPLLQSNVDQFVLHFDVAGISRNCFKTLQDVRNLSVHFMLDEDGTLYQTLDLKEEAWHATTSNNRSVGIEIANIGAYSGKDPLADWYKKRCGRKNNPHPSAGPRTEPGKDAKFCRPSGAARHDHGRGAGPSGASVRLYAAAIRRAGEIDRDLVHDLSENKMRLSAGGGRQVDDAQIAQSRIRSI